MIPRFPFSAAVPRDFTLRATYVLNGQHYRDGWEPHANLDIFWLKDDSLEDSANLPDPDVLAAEIVADLEAALEQFATIADDLKKP
jgi:hypothetical protein